MRPFRASAVALLSLISSYCFAADGLVAVKSPRGVKDTIDRFESAAKSREATK